MKTVNPVAQDDPVTRDQPPPGQKVWHALGADNTAAALDVDPATGLDPAEIDRRLDSFGANLLPEAQRPSALAAFLRQFQSPLIYILFVAAVLAFALGHQGDAGVILIVVFVNAAIGWIQEGRAERSMDALRRLSAVKARVLRAGQEHMIDAGGLVPGDILLLAAGDAVGVDARLFEARSLEAAEAALTGESLPVAKHTQPLPAETLLADRCNMVYSGTHITAGRGQAVVVATGSATEVGRIARLTEAAEAPKTPLELRIAQFGRYLVAAAIGLFVVVVAIGLLRGVPPVEIFMVAISQMVSMVPEGLPVAMTIALAVGMQRMAARGAIVRRLSAVETLGSTTVICSDKTGTLTRNEMTVTRVWLPDSQEIRVSGVGYAPEGTFTDADGAPILEPDPVLSNLLEAAVLCNDAQLLPPEEDEPRWQALGDPTEVALLTLAHKGRVDGGGLRHQWPRAAEIPFDASTKMMATEHRGGDATGRVLLKGAPEAILGLCTSARVASGVVDFDEAARQRAATIADGLADQALRVLALAEVPGGGLGGRLRAISRSRGAAGSDRSNGSATR